MAIKIFLTSAIIFIVAILYGKLTFDPIEALRHSYHEENETKYLILGIIFFACAIAMIVSALVIVWSMI